MNTIERLQKLSGIIVTEAQAYGEKKYAEHDKSGLQAAKKELQGILATTARSSFKYKNAQEEMKVIEACLRKLEDADKKEVKESIDSDMRAGMDAERERIESYGPEFMELAVLAAHYKREGNRAKCDEIRERMYELNGGNLDDIEAVVTRLAHGNPVFESKESDDDSDKKSDKKDDNDSDKEDKKSDKKDDDDSDKDDKKSEKKDDDKEDKTPDFLKKSDKKDDADDSDKDDKKSDKKDDSDKKDKSDDDSDDDDDEEDEKKICEAATPDHMTDSQKEKREDIVHGMKKNKAELKKKYGPKWKEVMYATATKNAMESVESAADVAARLVAEESTPIKVEVDYENGPVENSGIKKEQSTKVRIPADVKNAVKQRIAELDKAILAYDDKGYDDKSIKQQAVDCLNQIMQDIGDGSIEGVKKAQIYFETLMSPLTDFFPPQIINWLANALNPYVNKAE